MATRKNQSQKKSQKKSAGVKVSRNVVIAIFVMAVLFVGTMFTLHKINSEWTRPVDQKISEIFHLNPEDKKTEAPAATKPEAVSRGSKDTASTATASSTSSSGSKKPVEKENTPLYFGNISGATADTSNYDNYLMVKPQFTLSYNRTNLVPNWVMWHLEESDSGDVDRMDDFRPDPDLPKGWYGVTKPDYQYNKYNFDRGHVCPSADRTKTEADNSMTFLMTNMLPQSPDLNRQVWRYLEEYERDLAKQGKELYVAAGPYGQGGTTGTGKWNTIDIIPNKKVPESQNQKILVPSHCWKVILVLDAGNDDYNRVTKDTETIAVMMPNEMGMHKNGSWDQFIVTVDEVEEKTGYDFFSYLPDDIEDAIESKKYVKK